MTKELIREAWTAGGRAEVQGHIEAIDAYNLSAEIRIYKGDQSVFIRFATPEAGIRPEDPLMPWKLYEKHKVDIGRSIIQLGEFASLTVARSRARRFLEDGAK